MAKTILFDFDGTLADTVIAGVAVFNELARRRGYVEITPDNAKELRGMGPRAAMKALHIPMLRAPLVIRSLRKGIRAALPGLAVTNGMRAAVLLLRERGYQLGIVTTNSEENVQAFLQNNGMDDAFDFIRAGVGVFSKARAIKKVIAHEGLKKDETIFVGDEIRDIEAAQKNKIPAIAVTWGLNSREGLATAEPDFIVSSARELADLF